MNRSIISPFEQTLFCLEKFRLLLQVSILFVCNYHPLKWQCFIAWSFFLWMTIFAILETITRILYVINSKICCFNAALFSIAFSSRYQVVKIPLVVALLPLISFSRLVSDNVTSLFPLLMASTARGLEFTIALISAKKASSDSLSKLVLCLQNWWKYSTSR